MSRSKVLLEVIPNFFGFDLNLKQVTATELDSVKYFDLVFTHKKKKHFYFFKIISPSDVEYETLRSIGYQRKQVLQEKASFWKWKVDSLAFIYISDALLTPELLKNLADFDEVGRKIGSNLIWVNVFIHAASTFTRHPSYFKRGRGRPFKKLLDDIMDLILSPHYRQIQEDSPSSLDQSPLVTANITKTDIVMSKTSEDIEDSDPPKITPFYCQLCCESHAAGTPKLQCEKCSRYVCIVSYSDMVKAGRTSCPMCEGRLIAS